MDNRTPEQIRLWQAIEPFHKRMTPLGEAVRDATDEQFKNGGVSPPTADRLRFEAAASGEFTLHEIETLDIARLFHLAIGREVGRIRQSNGGNGKAGGKGGAGNGTKKGKPPVQRNRKPDVKRRGEIYAAWIKHDKNATAAGKELDLSKQRVSVVCREHQKTIDKAGRSSGQSVEADQSLSDMDLTDERGKSDKRTARRVCVKSL